MQSQIGKSFFDNIRRYVKISYFISSIIPLALLAYMSVKYIYPYLQLELPIYIGVLLFLAVAISLLGLSLLTKTTNASILSLHDLHSRLNALIDITKHFRETIYIDLLLGNIIKSAMRLNSTEAGSLLLCDEAGNLRVKFFTGEHPRLNDRIVKVGEGISGWVAKTGKPALVNDVTKDSRYNPDVDAGSRVTARSIMCVPLIYINKVIGVIELLNKKSGIFTKEDEELLHALADHAAISIAHSRLLENQQSDMINITEIFVAAQDSYNHEKKGHARRVANYANLIGRKMGIPENELRNLHYACLFHDIGLIKISIDEQLLKERYKQHPQFGYDMIQPISLWSNAAELILNHHERYDGNGYPSGKKGKEIPLGTRILFVAEVFDVLTSKNSYKDPIDRDAAINEIDVNAGLQFDPEVVKAFKEAIKDSDIIVE